MIKTVIEEGTGVERQCLVKTAEASLVNWFVTGYSSKIRKDEIGWHHGAIRPMGCFFIFRRYV
jgi:hypothetical protein